MPSSTAVPCARHWRPPMIRLDIFSDPVCPWCYLGKANLDRALEAHPEHPFMIEWHPFQLAPQMPRGGVDRASRRSVVAAVEHQVDVRQQTIEQFRVGPALSADLSTPPMNLVLPARTPLPATISPPNLNTLSSESLLKMELMSI